MELTRTAQTLLDRAKKHPHGVFSVTVQFMKTYTAGGRERTAANLLVQRGIAVRIGAETSTDTMRDGSGRSRKYHTTIYQLKCAITISKQG